MNKIVYLLHIHPIKHNKLPFFLNPPLTIEPPFAQPFLKALAFPPTYGDKVPRHEADEGSPIAALLLPKKQNAHVIAFTTTQAFEIT